MSRHLDDFLSTKNKHSSQHVQKRFKNRHRKIKESFDELPHKRRSQSRGIAFEIETGVKDFSSDEDMLEVFEDEHEHQPTSTWMCDMCTSVNSGSCSQCTICASSRPNLGKPITIRNFLSAPQAMDLDDEPNSTNPFLQNAIHLSLQSFRNPSMFGSTTTTTTTTTTHNYNPFMAMPMAVPSMIVSQDGNVGQFQQHHHRHTPRRSSPPIVSRRKRVSRRRRDPSKFDRYWSDAQTNAVNLVGGDHYERNPDDMLRSFEPIGTKKQFNLKFGVPRAIVDRGMGGSFVTSSFNSRQKTKKKNAREERKARKLAQFYRHIYVDTRESGRREKLEIARIVRSLYSYVPGELRQRKRFDGRYHSDCQACYAVNFDEKEAEDEGIVIPQCGHRTVCSDCFESYLRIRIRDEDIVPWLPCPMPDCKTCVPPELLIGYLSMDDLYKFTSVFLRQHLKRNSNWTSCDADGCAFGFVRTETCTFETAICDACGNEQDFAAPSPEEEDGFAALLADGTMRLCPKCEYPTMKDYGMCNVMQCNQCGIWWNWRTRDVGNSSADVKNRARMRGTLWEPGELEYQWHLQDTNLPAFKELLSRNGIKYDPNYVRGSG